MSKCHSVMQTGTCVPVIGATHAADGTCVLSFLRPLDISKHVLHPPAERFGSDGKRNASRLGKAKALRERRIEGAYDNPCILGQVREEAADDRNPKPMGGIGKGGIVAVRFNLDGLRDTGLAENLVEFHAGGPVAAGQDQRNIA